MRSHHPGVLDVGQVDGAARDAHVLELAAVDLLHLEKHFGTRGAAHLLAAFSARQPLHALPVDQQYLVAGTQPRSIGRRILVGLVDDDVALQVGLVDDGADASVALVDHHTQVFVFLFGHIDGVRVEVGEHCVYAGALDAVHGKRIHIGAVELFEYGGVDFRPLAELEALGLGARGERSAHEQQGYESFLHFHPITDCSSASTIVPLRGGPCPCGRWRS